MCLTWITEKKFHTCKELTRHLWFFSIFSPIFNRIPIKFWEKLAAKTVRNNNNKTKEKQKEEKNLNVDSFSADKMMNLILVAVVCLPPAIAVGCLAFIVDLIVGDKLVKKSLCGNIVEYNKNNNKNKGKNI